MAGRHRCVFVLRASRAYKDCFLDYFLDDGVPETCHWLGCLMERNTEKLRQTATDGAKWAVAARLIRVLFTIATLSVLSRFLSPEAFGTLALIMFVVGLAQMIGDFGARLALVQRKDITEVHRSSVFWFNLTLYLTLFALTLGFAPQIAALFTAPEMVQPLRWISVLFLIQSVQGVSLAVLERRFAFRWIAISETVGGISGSLVAIALVLNSAGITALVAQQIVAVAVTTMMICSKARWFPRFILNWRELWPLLSYGSYVTLAGLVQFGANNADRPIIGGGLSPEALGFYSISQQIVASPLKMIVQVVRKVMFPVLSSIQDDEVRMGRAYKGTMHALFVLMAPICLGLLAVAAPLVDVMLGDGWELVGTLMAIMSIRALFQTFNDFHGSIFQAKGWARFQFRWSLWSSALSIGVLLLALPYGVVAMVGARTALAAVMTPLNSYFALGLVGLTLWQAIRNVAAPIVSAGIMALVVLQCQKALDLASIWELVVSVLIGVVVYGGLMMLLDRKRVLDLAQSAIEKRRKG